MILTAVAAMARNRTIGLNNKLPWHLPEDLQFFKDITRGKIILMGRKTFESIGSKPLPGRPTIVITRQTDLRAGHELVKFAPSLPAAISIARTLQPQYPEEVIVAGGTEIYRQSLPLLDRIYLSVIDQDFAGDAHFPALDGSGLKLISTEKRTGALPFAIETYERV